MARFDYSLTLAISREDGSPADRIVKPMIGRVELEPGEEGHVLSEVLGHALAQVDDTELADVMVPDAQLLAPGATGA